jgi:hypothetical protein
VRNRRLRPPDRHPRARLARPKYFDAPRVPMAELERLLRSKAVLLPGVAVTLDIEQADGSVQ